MILLRTILTMSIEHCLNIISQVTSEDMKSEDKYYGNVIVLNRT